MPTATAPIDRSNGEIQPRSNAYLRKSPAAISNAATPTASKPRCPNHCSRSSRRGAGAAVSGTSA